MEFVIGKKHSGASYEGEQENQNGPANRRPFPQIRDRKHRRRIASLLVDAKEGRNILTKLKYAVFCSC
jgi:hypothetical protein